MRSSQELAALRERAVQLRREGKSRRQIKEILGFIGNSTLNQLLRDAPLPPERAGPDYAESRARADEGVRRYWAAERPAREAARAAISAAAAAQVGVLTDREIIMAGVIAYWCEGAKSKPYRIDEQVRFVNSDPALIKFFLTFLEKAGVARERLRYCVMIHEIADVEAATRYWANVTGGAPHQFTRPVIKHHTPRTSRPARQRGLPRLPANIRDEEQRVVPRDQRLVAWRHDRQAAVSGMNTSTRRKPDQLHVQAVALRRAGKSVRQIKQILGPIGNRALYEALQGEPPPDWTRRPNAKDALRTKARDLRLQGLDYGEIVARLGVSKSSVSLWVRDIPRPPRVAPDDAPRRTSERMRRYWTAERQVRAARRAAAGTAAAADIGA